MWFEMRTDQNKKTRAKWEEQAKVRKISKNKPITNEKMMRTEVDRNQQEGKEKLNNYVKVDWE